MGVSPPETSPCTPLRKTWQSRGSRPHPLHNCCGRNHPLPTVRLTTSTLDWGVGGNVPRLGQSMTRQRKPYPQPTAHAVLRFWNRRQVLLHRVFVALPTTAEFRLDLSSMRVLLLQRLRLAAHSMFLGTTGQRALARGWSAPAPSLWSEPQLVYAAKPAPQSPAMCACGISTSTSIASMTGESRSLLMDSRFGGSAAGSRRHFGVGA